MADGRPYWKIHFGYKSNNLFDLREILCHNDGRMNVGTGIFSET